MDFFSKFELDINLKIGQKITIKELEKYMQEFFSTTKLFSKLVLENDSYIERAIYTKTDDFIISFIFEVKKNSDSRPCKTIEELKEQELIIKDINCSFYFRDKIFYGGADKNFWYKKIRSHHTIWQLLL